MPCDESAGGPGISGGPHAAAEYWIERWNKYRDASRSGPRERARFWDDPAAACRYARREEESKGGKRRIELIIEDLAPHREDRVLEIGPGPGTITLPLAKMAASITAVEPAQGMREVLAERIEAEGIANITVVPERWEDVSPEELGGPFDIVLCSFALVMDDLKGAVEKMTALCRGRVCLYQGSGKSSRHTMKRQLWPALHGRDLPVPPEEDILYNLLLCLGYPVEARRFSYTYTDRWRCVDDLVRDLGPSYKLTTPEMERRFTKLMAPLVEKDADGYRAQGYEEFTGYSWKVPR
jgi:hypothetical protein